MREPATGHANPYRGVNRLRRSFYRRLSLLGERLGIDSLTYNRGVFQSFHEAALANAPKIADAVMAEFPDTRSLADVGCGSGGFAAEFIRRGVRVMGCEYSARGREWCRRQGVPCVRFDVSRAGTGLEGTPYDLAMSLEVAEHVPATLADAFVDFFAACAPVLVFTAAQPGQQGTGHINCQPKSYWTAKMARRGMIHDDEAAGRVASSLRLSGAAEYLSDNMMIFRRGA
ncbi:MAG: methyltransferase domain-containing protein [Phycisphaeraceae bacterium]|nr:methyltransferase domain-containing protein [Phycisphaeraceae bacterium]